MARVIENAKCQRIGSIRSASACKSEKAHWVGGRGALHLDDRLADGILLCLLLLGARPKPAEAVRNMATK